MQSASRFQSTLHPSYLALSPVSLLRWSLFAAGRGQDVNSFTACGNPTISLAAPVRKGSGTLSAPPPRRVSPLRSLSSCSSTPAAFWLHSTRTRRECMHSKFQFYHMERMRNFEILKSQNCGKVCLPIRISGSAIRGRADGPTRFLLLSVKMVRKTGTSGVRNLLLK